MIWPDIRSAEYPASPKSGYRYRISGRISIDARYLAGCPVRFSNQPNFIPVGMSSKIRYEKKPEVNRVSFFLTLTKAFCCLEKSAFKNNCLGKLRYYNQIVQSDGGYPAFSISCIRPDIRQVKSGIRPDTGYQKRADNLAGYPVHPYR
jgi:hypothetical protein